MSFLVSLATSRLFPYLVAGVLAVGFVWYVYHAGELAERQRQEIADLQHDNKVLTQDIERKRRAAEADARAAEKDAQIIADLDAKLKDMLNEISKPDDQCFSDADTDSLRRNW